MIFSDCINFENQMGIRVPMSVGSLRDETTKKGVPCQVCDVIINDQIAAEILLDPEMKQFFLQICNLLSFINNFHLQ